MHSCKRAARHLGYENGAKCTEISGEMRHEGGNASAEMHIPHVCSTGNPISWTATCTASPATPQCSQLLFLLPQGQTAKHIFLQTQKCFAMRAFVFSMLHCSLWVLIRAKPGAKALLQEPHCTPATTDQTMTQPKRIFHICYARGEQTAGAGQHQHNSECTLLPGEQEQR